jgi:hypothetical protein
MFVRRPAIGKKGAGRKIAQELGEARRQPPSRKILDIVNEISDREKGKIKKIH